MTSTKRTLVALAAAALLLGGAMPSPGQRGRPRSSRVSLNVSAGDFHGFVRSTDGGFEAVALAKKGGGLAYPRNFSPDSWILDGRYMGRDAKGESKAVPARARETADAKWDKVIDKRGKLLRVPKGPLMGWWVGLGKETKSKEGHWRYRPLVLVKEKKDAAAFSWRFPEDDYSP